LRQHETSQTSIASETVFKGRLLHVLQDEVQLPDGHTARREYVKHPGAVMIIPLLDERTIVLEYQFRFPLGRHFFELPAGKMEADEDALTTAKRELLEETGYSAQKWRHVATTHPCIGYSDEKIELFLAQDLTFIGHRRDQGEFLEVVVLSIDEALEWIDRGTISDGKTIMGLLWAERLLRTL
jgi:ADP-ribose pyrophosphatase